MAERKHYTAEEKAAIVLEVIQDGKKISEVAEEHQIHPNQIMNWRKQALETMAELFKTELKDITAKKEKREISEMKKQIANKDSMPRSRGSYTTMENSMSAMISTSFSSSLRLWTQRNVLSIRSQTARSNASTGP